MQWYVIDNPELKWEAVSRWVLAWDPMLKPQDLDVWAAGLQAAASDIDPAVLWAPDHDGAAAPSGMSADRLDACLRRAIAAFAGLTGRTG